MIHLIVMAKYFPSQVVFESPEKRKEMQEFCREHFGRSFSEQCRYMLLEAKRMAKQAEKAAA